jgi:N-acetylneuraminic acid mutarotase/uncharacterized protein YkwD
MLASRSASRWRRVPVLEELERRDLLAGFGPTPIEQQMLEELNDIRANPPAYSDWSGIDLSAIAPSQPLAFNPLLIQAATGHSQDMNVNNYAGHTGSDGSTPASRVAAAGFACTGACPGESVAVGNGMTPDAALAGLIQDFGQPDIGHRRHLLAIDSGYKPHNQIGIGAILNGTGAYGNYYTLDTGNDADPRPFLTGVVYNDANGNGHYDAGEGLSGVTISVAGVGSFAAWDTGGYSIPLSPGTYSVTASGGRMAAPVTTTVTVGSTNYRLNFIGHNTLAWNTVASLPAARSQLAAATDSSGRIYAIGGQDAMANLLTEVDVYTPSTGTWSSAASLPQALSGLAAVSGTDGKIYVLGHGDSFLGQVNSVDVYDPSANQWTPLTSDPIPGTFDQAEVARGPDGKIYVFGGFDSNHNVLASVAVFDPAAAAGQRWSTLLNMPFARAAGAAALGPDGNIYLAGGYGGSGFGAPFVARVDVFNPASDSWSQAPDMPYASTPGMTLTTGADGRIYIVGTNIPGAPTVQTYQPSTGTWAAATDIPTPRDDAAATLGTDGQLYILGGRVTNTAANGFTSFAPSAVVEALPTANALAPVASFTFLSYSGPPLPPGGSGGPTKHPATDVTRQVSVRRGPLVRKKGRWQQTLTLHNGGAALSGPLMLVFDHLGPQTALRHRSGLTRAHKPKKSPYWVVPLGPSGFLDGGATMTVSVEFAGARPHYSIQVLDGTGKV